MTDVTTRAVYIVDYSRGPGAHADFDRTPVVLTTGYSDLESIRRIIAVRDFSDPERFTEIKVLRMTLRGTEELDENGNVLGNRFNRL